MQHLGVQMEVVEVAGVREMLVVQVVVAVEEAGWVLRTWAVMGVLTAEEVEVEARDLPEE